MIKIYEIEGHLYVEDKEHQEYRRLGNHTITMSFEDVAESGVEVKLTDTLQ